MLYDVVNKDAAGSSPSFKVPPLVETKYRLDPNIEVSGRSKAASLDLSTDYLAFGSEPGRRTENPYTEDRKLISAPGMAGIAHVNVSKNQFTQVKAPNSKPGDHFGRGVAIENDVLAVGLPYYGAAIYRLQGKSWIYDTKLELPPIPRFSSDAGKGEVVRWGYAGNDIAINGSWLALAAYGTEFGWGDDYGGSPDPSGAVLLFKRANESWDFHSFVRQPYPILGVEGFQHFSIYWATDVDLSNERLVVGAPSLGATDEDGGGAFVYHYDGTHWNFEALLRAPGCLGPDWFGESVAIDGETIVVGAPLDTRFGSEGAAYVYKLEASNWKFTHSLFPHGENAGSSVAINGDRILVGAPGSGGLFDSDGAAYLYSLSES